LELLHAFPLDTVQKDGSEYKIFFLNTLKAVENSEKQQSKDFGRDIMVFT